MILFHCICHHFVDMNVRSIFKIARDLKSVVEKRDYEFYRKNDYKKDEISKVFRNALHVESDVRLTNRIE